MEVNLTPDQQAFVKHAIEIGRLHREEEAVEEALALWEERERRRIEFLASLEAAHASAQRGEGWEITSESMRALAEDTKKRGRERLVAKLAAER
jgi:Arc/MetJ-type ribon-helix-helix transcriptional regulator